MSPSWLLKQRIALKDLIWEEKNSKYFFAVVIKNANVKTNLLFQLVYGGGIKHYSVNSMCKNTFFFSLSIPGLYIG